MWPSVLLIALLLAPQGVDLAALAAAARDATDPAARRGAAERFLEERTRPCKAAAPADAGAWPAGGDVVLATEVFFVQSVNEEIERQQQRAARDMMQRILQPLGIHVAEGVAAPPSPAAAIVFTGIAEALPPHGEITNAITGTSWRGAMSLHSSGRCVFSRALESRVQPPPGPGAFLVLSPSDAPFLDSLEPALLEALIAVAEVTRGQTGLARIAGSDADASACLAALARITDQALLSGLARTAKAPWVRIPAVSRLLDVNRLAAIARLDPDPDVRRAAQARIGELKKKARDGCLPERP
jgi:hypothetical protein